MPDVSNAERPDLTPSRNLDKGNEDTEARRLINQGGTE